MLNLVSWRTETDLPPAHLDGVAEVQRVHGLFALLEVADVKVGQRVVDKSVHGAVGAVHVLVDHPRDEVWGEGDDKRLGGWGGGDETVGVGGGQRLGKDMKLECANETVWNGTTYVSGWNESIHSFIRWGLWESTLLFPQQCSLLSNIHSLDDNCTWITHLPGFRLNYRSQCWIYPLNSWFEKKPTWNQKKKNGCNQEVTPCAVGGTSMEP